MAKIHLQANTGARREPMAMCSTYLTAQGTVKNNHRRSYVGMSSAIVSMKEFAAASEADRCAHCCDIGLARRNRQRKLNGKEPISHVCEGHFPVK